MTNQNTVTVRGVQFDNAKNANFQKKIGSVNETLTVWANAAALQYAGYGNNKWINDLFNVAELRNVNGTLSSKGREVANYIQFFAPIIIKETQGEAANEKTVSISLTKNKRKKGMFATLERDDNDQRLLVDAVENPDFPLDLREFCNMQKASKSGSGDKPAPKASQLATRVEKLAASFADDAPAQPTGTAAEFKTLADNALALYNAALDALSQAANSEQQVLVELTAAEKSANTTSGKEKRADIDRAKYAEAV